MDSFTVTFTGNQSVLKADFFPEVSLEDDKYELALLDFTSYQLPLNIIEGKNNKLLVKYPVAEKVKRKNEKGKEIESIVYKDKEKTIEFSTGSYEIDDILTYIKAQLSLIQVNLTYDINTATSKIKLVFDTNIKCVNSHILTALGFEKTQSFERQKTYWSHCFIKLSDIDIFRINCDIVSDSFINGTRCHTIHQFARFRIANDFKYIEVPRNLIYLAVNQKRFSSIQISIVDQNGNPIDIRGEINCRIHIRKVQN